MFLPIVWKSIATYVNVVLCERLRIFAHHVGQMPLADAILVVLHLHELIVLLGPLNVRPHRFAGFLRFNDDATGACSRRAAGLLRGDQARLMGAKSINVNMSVEVMQPLREEIFLNYVQPTS